MLAYAKEVADRIKAIGAPGYKPRIHLDVYGTLGDLFGDDMDALCDFLGASRQRSSPSGFPDRDARVASPTASKDRSICLRVCARA